MAEPIITIGILSFISAVVTTVVGFGAGMLLTPLLAIFLPLQEALAIGALVFLVTSSSKILWYVRDIDWGAWRAGFLLSLPGLVAGFAMLLWVSAIWLEKIFALVLLGLAIGVLRGQQRLLPALPYWSYPVAGGFLSAILHAGGPMYYCFCRGRGLDRMRTVGSMAVIHFSLNVLKVGFFARLGALDAERVVRIAPACLLAVIGTWVGRHLLIKWVDERNFERMVGITMLALALRYLF